MKQGFPTREDQIDRRRERAEKGAFRIRNTGEDPVFSIFEVASPSGRTYRVHVRSLGTPENSCTCPDYHANLLGTCKHVEATLLKVRSRLGKRALAAARPTCAQVYLGYAEDVAVRVARPDGLPAPVASLLANHFDAGGLFRGDPTSDVAAFLHDREALDAGDRGKILVADEVLAHAERLKEDLEDRRLLEWYLERVRRGDRSFRLLSRPLYPFQTQGLLHLAFKRRSLLADDMGLGKTVQALAASVLLREIKGVRRALVVCPASLKHQWAREIARFTSLPVQVVQGSAAGRRGQYDTPAFFTLANYELILRDLPTVERSRFDLVILDEAQRIRNWKTKTADAVKAIPSRYAFVLTGTPLENRLDDLYSIFQFIDPRILGPLWRFNERYFILEKKKSGSYRIHGHKNLAELRKRIAPKVLRRKKEDVLADLPEKVENNYFVELTPEQRKPYDEYRARAASLVARAQRRPLTPSEEKSLLTAVVKMRILCNALELHERDIDEDLAERTRPKIRELERILQEQVLEGGRKALVFSQWEGMIDIASRLLEGMHVGAVKLSGSVPSRKRGALIDRFREDPDVRVFLSTDAGSVGLNLQPGSLVVNLDVPWNPAVLDQRVGRTHRIGQREVVNVVNLVARDTIEERVLDALASKRTLFLGVFGDEGEAPDTVTVGARGLLAGRLHEVFSGDVPKPSPPADSTEAPPRTDAPPAVRREEEPYQRLADALLPKLKGNLLLLRPAPSPFGRGKVIVVVDHGVAEAKAIVRECLETVSVEFGLPAAPACALFDREGYRSLLALAGGNDDDAEGYRAPAFTEGRSRSRAAVGADRSRARKARAWVREGRDRYAFGDHALAGGFPAEALAPLRQALTLAVRALLSVHGKDPSRCQDPAFLEDALVRPGHLPEGLTGPLFLALNTDADEGALSAPTLRKIAGAADALLALADERVLEALA